MFGGAKVSGHRAVDVVAWFAVAVIAVYPSAWGLAAAVMLFATLLMLGRYRFAAKLRA
jgi:hypothetical protein